MSSKHSQNSGEYLSPPNGYINYYGYNHFTTPIPYLKSIRVHYKIYCDNYRIIGNYNHGLYVRVGSSWYLAGSVSMSYTTSDDSEFSYMGETDIDVTVNRANVTDWCIVPTSLPNGTYEWWPQENVGNGRLTIQESITENTMIDSNYLTNIIRGNTLTTRSSSTTVESYINTFYNSFAPKVITLDIDNDLIDATEIHVNIGGTVKKITNNAKVATGSCDWSSGSTYDRTILFSFTAEFSSYRFNIAENSSDNSYIRYQMLIDSSTNETIKIQSNNIISDLVVGRKYYILLDNYDSDYNDTLSVDILLYPLVDIRNTLENMLEITGTQTALSFTETGTMKQNFCGLIKLNVTTLPKNMYFMMYNFKVSSTYQDGFMAIYDSEGNQLYRCDDDSSGWTSLQSSHPTLGSKTTYQARDPLIITTKNHSNGPFYVEFRKLSLSGTSTMNYTIEWGSL